MTFGLPPCPTPGEPRPTSCVIAQPADSDLDATGSQGLATLERRLPERLEVEVGGAGQTSTQDNDFGVKQADEIGDGMPEEPASALERLPSDSIALPRRRGDVVGGQCRPRQMGQRALRAASERLADRAYDAGSGCGRLQATDTAGLALLLVRQDHPARAPRELVGAAHQTAATDDSSANARPHDQRERRTSRAPRPATPHRSPRRCGRSRPPPALEAASPAGARGVRAPSPVSSGPRPYPSGGPSQGRPRRPRSSQRRAGVAPCRVAPRLPQGRAAPHAANLPDRAVGGRQINRLGLPSADLPLRVDYRQGELGPAEISSQNAVTSEEWQMGSRNLRVPRLVSEHLVIGAVYLDLGEDAVKQSVARPSEEINAAHLALLQLLARSKTAQQ